MGRCLTRAPKLLVTHINVASFASDARKVLPMHHGRGAIMQCFVPRPHPQYVASTNCLNLKFTVSEPRVTVAMAGLLVHLMMSAIEMQNSVKSLSALF